MQKTILGVGIASHANSKDMQKLLYILPKIKIDAIATLSGKEHHESIVFLAKTLNCAILPLTVLQLESMTPFLKNKSAKLYERIGCHSVAEAAALFACGTGASLILEKTTFDSIVIAVATTIE